MKLNIRLHGRGGQGIKTAGRVVGTAAFLAGYYAQDSPMYGPERRGAHVSSFVRISDEPVDGRGYIAAPDAVAIADHSLLEQASPLQGLRSGGVVIINAAKHVELGIPTIQQAVLDISTLANKILGRDAVSAGVGAAVCKALGIAGRADVIEAVKMEMEELGLRDELIEANIKLAEECYAAIPTLQLKTNEEDMLMERDEIVEIPATPAPASVALISAAGNSTARKTGAWRDATPVINYQKCTRCMVCYIYCPDSCISLDETLTPHIDYEHCKGCLICFMECPPRAIQVEV